jgi:hypothetical protein
MRRFIFCAAGIAALIIFDVTTQLTPDLTFPLNANSVTFNNTAGTFNLFWTTGNALTIGADGVTSNDAVAMTISHAIMLGAAQTWNAAAGGLSITGAVNNGGNLLTIGAASRLTLTASGVLSGMGGLTKKGTGRNP